MTDVVIVLDGLWVGGTERSMSELLPLLRQRGVDATIASLRRRDEGVEAATIASGGRVEFVPAGSTTRQIRGWRAMLRARRPDVVHTALFRAGLVGRLAAAGLPCAVLTSLVNTPYEPERRGDPAVRPVALELVRIADAVLGRFFTDHFHAVSRAACDSAVARLKIRADRVTVVERGRDPARMGQPSAERRRQARSALGLGESDEVIAAIGRQDYQKGFERLIEAVALLAGRPRLKLLLAGREGSMSATLRSLVADRGVEERVRFLGHRSDVPEILAAADMFAMSSRFEGFPGAIIEAMALGLPIVAAAIAPVREIVTSGENGLLVHPPTGKGFADAIEALLADRPTAMAMGERNRARFVERHTLERSADAMAALYRRLAEGNPAGAGHAGLP